MNRLSPLICCVTLVASLGMPKNGLAQTVTCQDVSLRVNAVALPGNHNITTKFQLDTPNLQVLMQTRVFVQGTTPSCVVANLSALTRITDNYVVYQLRIDGVPMEGQTGDSAGYPIPSSLQRSTMRRAVRRSLSNRFVYLLQESTAGTSSDRGDGRGRQQHYPRPGTAGGQPRADSAVSLRGCATSPIQPTACSRATF